MGGERGLKIENCEKGGLVYFDSLVQKFMPTSVCCAKKNYQPNYFF
jgi:hypothetical protein